MKQIENLKIEAEGKENVYFLFASAILGMLDMIEKGIVTADDVSMAFCLPIMFRIEENTLMHEICSRVDELETYRPAKRQDEIEKIRKLCFNLTADYNRADTLKKQDYISFEF